MRRALAAAEDQAALSTGPAWTTGVPPRRLRAARSPSRSARRQAVVREETFAPILYVMG